MDDRFRGVPSEEIEELEPIDEAEELEVFAAEPSLDALLLTFPNLRDLIRSQARSPAPMAILDEFLGFLYRNPSLIALMRRFRYPDSPSFLHSFSRSLGERGGQELAAAVLNPDRGWSWEGELVHRSKDAAALHTRVSAMPLWFKDEDPRPQAFYVHFHDVTEGRRNNVRQAYESLLKASLKKDNDTGRHIERVNRYSRCLAERLFKDPRWPEVDVDFLEDVGFLAAMHDVGKIGTPDDILNKTGPLTEAEWKIMKEHTINGAFILDGHPNPMAKQIALSHHEWWNGSGYPYNLEGTMIPLAARIVQVADVYDALRMQRSYKPAYPHEVALEKMLKERGVHFDPVLIDVFRSHAGAFKEIYAGYADET